MRDCPQQYCFTLEVWVFHGYGRQPGTPFVCMLLLLWYTAVLKLFDVQGCTSLFWLLLSPAAGHNLLLS